MPLVQRTSQNLKTRRYSMKDDSELRRDVEQELEWEPSVDERRIGVSVIDGIVTLTGDVGSYAERWNAERAVERVKGVRGIADDLVVKSETERSDTDIAKAAADALSWNVLVPADHVTVRVQKGWLTLSGQVELEYQRRAAEQTVRHLRGVRGITNVITVSPRVEPSQVKRRIEETFKREASLDASRITVQASGGEITLLGSVRSWVERHEAEKSAWAAPGVRAVHNHITVEPVTAAA
jgi:osmotically-inducible protein OsmY